jgi:hypothetical protein
MYEPIRGRDDPEQENKCAVLHSSAIEEDEDDVEMAVHARSRLAIPNAAGGFNKIQEESSKQKQQQQQRLVSLDVFRGITVAVILSPRLLSLILLHCFFFFQVLLLFPFICIRSKLGLLCTFILFNGR